MSRNRTTSAATIGIIAVAGLFLTGCAGGQSKAEACSIVQTTLEDAQTELTDSVSSFGNDPVAGAEAVTELSETFSEANDKITNEDVKPESTKATEALSGFAEQMEIAAADPDNADQTALTDAITEVQTTFGDLQTVCQG
ncbi:hypothetical protein [Mycetocola zhujimingii]|uniref:Uncharacterized protein n=1 Tax=Mycetocola zhujimingii TaxID=2079792 RepID=A0A2U1TDP6_9MICO|nr:hypothetical protein [Mycetocola zhujimingii]AWB87110.1 hypothetical protein C3E77_11140 [Mycetocola zhujimingii]PWC06996.1 hypothetical protein DF223_08470 [Mycetocola zhujimingii]